MINKAEHVYMFVRFTVRNVFVNLFQVDEDGRLKPILFRTLNQYNRHEGKKLKHSVEFVKEFAEILAGWIKRLDLKRFDVVFKNHGVNFAREGQSDRGIGKKRELFLNAFIKEDLPVVGVADKSSIPFNGCKPKKVRRRKKSYEDRKRIGNMLRIVSRPMSAGKSLDEVT